MKKILCLASLLSAFLFTGSAAAADKPAAERFTEADAAFLNRGDRAAAYNALKLYGEFYAQAPDDFESAWRYSMACYFVGFNYTRERAEKIRLFGAGRDAGLKALQLSPGSAEGHFWAAVNMALYGETAGVFKMLFTLGTVRGHLAKSAEREPGYAYGGAFRVLGKIEESLPGILGGSRDAAMTYYDKAIASVPDEPLNYLFKAKLLADGYGNRQEALGVALRGLDKPVPDPSRYESLQALIILRDFTAALQKEQDTPSRVIRKIPAR
ncbi:MAG: hypothetical protein ACYC5N_08050 [Endomicrobiales bacterium]